MFLNGDRISFSSIELNAMEAVMNTAGTVIMLGGFVSALVVVVVVVCYWLIKGFLSLPSIFSLLLFPNSLFHGIFPRIILETDVLVMAED